MKFILRNYCFLLLIIILLGSCTAYKGIPYMKDAATISEKEFAQAAKNYEATIMTNDILLITVNTPTVAASAEFNLPLIPQGANAIIQTNVATSSANSGSLQNYIVDNDGCIDFPVLGKLKLGGLTKSQSQRLIRDKIYPEYLTEEPIVVIRFLNYKVSVLGEVAKPGIYTAQNEQITLLDALAMAGDLTIHGNRKNVLLVREDNDGKRSTRQINLQDKDILLNNDIYYLQQNDKIYVQPNKTKGNSSSIGALESMALSGISLVISVISIITR